MLFATKSVFLTLLLVLSTSSIHPTFALWGRTAASSATQATRDVQQGDTPLRSGELLHPQASTDDNHINQNAAFPNTAQLDVPASMYSAVFSHAHVALQEYEKKPDCLLDAASPSHCTDIKDRQGARTRAAIAMTLCEISTAKLSVPLECTRLAEHSEPSACVEALSRSPQLWASYSGHLRDIATLCLAFGQLREVDEARQLYASLAREKKALLELLKAREASTKQFEQQARARMNEEAQARDKAATDALHEAALKHHSLVEAQLNSVSAELLNLVHGAVDFHVAELTNKATAHVASILRSTEQLKGSLSASIDMNQKSYEYGLKAMGRLRVASSDAGHAIESLRSSIEAAAESHHHRRALSAVAETEHEAHVQRLSEGLARLSENLLAQLAIVNATARATEGYSWQSVALRLIGLPDMGAPSFWNRRGRLEQLVDTLSPASFAESFMPSGIATTIAFSARGLAFITLLLLQAAYYCARHLVGLALCLIALSSKAARPLLARIGSRMLGYSNGRLDIIQP
ncbi:Nuclear fusion protein, KAR5 [Ceraceosorus bombacis]|uniref:Nuclear fusion protein, KAR5 n=1 Tax=Ceraceosorus bombacis TaxID=401625 RepID=A0A0P1BFL3_9BASI|nr:Nuclear fusion protein, KAR5 [Ceraceosorus bombacis]